MLEDRALPWAVRPYRPADRVAFIALNLEWIERWFSVEASDRAQLEGVEETILGRGGRVLVAERQDRVVGVGAIVPPRPAPAGGRQWFEVIKMATAPQWRGRGIGQALLEGLINEARLLGANGMWLETNTRLQAAIRLYTRAGFRALEPADWWPSPYARCDLQMVLEW